MPKFNSFVYDIVATFKPTVIYSLCCAKFRLSPQYKDQIPPFGFDWIRVGDATDYVSHDIPYKGNIGKQYRDELFTKECLLGSPDTYLKPIPQKYQELCRSYSPANLVMFPSEEGVKKPYHVPVLSIYPVSETAEDCKAYLVLEIDIKRTLRRIQVEYDRALFHIQGGHSLSARKGHYQYDISIACLKEFKTDRYIKVYAITRLGKKNLTGMIRVAKNAKEIRREINTLLVNVKIIASPDISIPFSGYAEAGKDLIRTILRHSLITPNFESTDLNLDYDPEIAKRIIIKKGCIYFIAYKSERLPDGRLISQNPDFPALEELLTQHLKKRKYLEKYDTIIYSMGMQIVRQSGDLYIPLNGYSHDHYVILTKDFSPITAAHENLHALGLVHTFDNNLLSGPPSPFTYRIFITDNIMDYSHYKKVKRTSLWEWQWKLLRLQGKPEQ